MSLLLTQQKPQQTAIVNLNPNRSVAERVEEVWILARTKSWGEIIVILRDIDPISPEGREALPILALMCLQATDCAHQYDRESIVGSRTTWYLSPPKDYPLPSKRGVILCQAILAQYQFICDSATLQQYIEDGRRGDKPYSPAAAHATYVLENTTPEEEDPLMQEARKEAMIRLYLLDREKLIEILAEQIPGCNTEHVLETPAGLCLDVLQDTLPTGVMLHHALWIKFLMEIYEQDKWILDYKDHEDYEKMKTRLEQNREGALQHAIAIFENIDFSTQDPLINEAKKVALDCFRRLKKLGEMRAAMKRGICRRRTVDISNDLQIQ